MKIKISSIKPNPNNPRTIKDSNFKKLVKSLQDFPEMLEKRPLVCITDTDGRYVVLGGNQRLKAAKEAGIQELPILLADDWTSQQQKEFVIKDNGDWYGEWDLEMLQADWNIEILNEWGLFVPETVPPFNQDDINNFFEADTEKQNVNKIILEYSDSDFKLVNEALKKHTGSKEQIFFKLLGL